MSRGYPVLLLPCLQEGGDITIPSLFPLYNFLPCHACVTSTHFSDILHLHPCVTAMFAGGGDIVIRRLFPLYNYLQCHACVTATHFSDSLH